MKSIDYVLPGLFLLILFSGSALLYADPENGSKEFFEYIKYLTSGMIGWIVREHLSRKHNVDA